jgi:hypothetical protein
VTTEGPRFTYRALAMLENEYEPKLRRRSPYWRPRPAPCWRDVLTPSWNWIHGDYHESLNMDLTVLDANGAFLSAASSATFAHGELTRTGALPSNNVAADGKVPGYFRIDWHSWSDSRIVSPLGNIGDEGGKVWVKHPTLELLTKLSTAGYWPEVRIHDSFTCPDRVRFRSWATAVNNDRAAALRDIDTAYRLGTPQEQQDADDWYEAVKNGYSMAVQLMLGPAEGGTVKSAVKRPDWYHTIHAQHAASTWRKVWSCILAGYVPVMMGSVDEVVWDTEDFRNIEADGLMKLDNSGIQLGAFKVKERITPATADAA